MKGYTPQEHRRALDRIRADLGLSKHPTGRHTFQELMTLNVLQAQKAQKKAKRRRN